MPPSDANNTNSAPHGLEEAHGSLQPRPIPLHPVAAALTPSALTAAPNALSLLKALRQRLVLALTIGLLLAAAAGAATWFLMPPPKITAHTQLYVASVQPNILFPDESRVRHADFVRSQAYLITDRFVLNAALRSPEVAELSIIKEQSDPVQWLEKQVKVEFPSPEFIHISLSGDRPPELQKLVSAITQSYLEGVVNKQRNARRDRLEDLKKVVNRFEERTRTKRTTLRSLQVENGALNEKGMAILQQLALEDLHGVKKDLTQVRSQLRQLQVDLGMRPDWVETVWPRYAVGLNCLPGLQLPINHAVVALLHDDAFVALGMPGGRSQLATRELDELIDKDKIVAEGIKQIQATASQAGAHARSLSGGGLREEQQAGASAARRPGEGSRGAARGIAAALLRKVSRATPSASEGNRRQMQEKYTSLKEMETRASRRGHAAGR